MNAPPAAPKPGTASTETDAAPQPVRPIVTDANRPFWEGCRAGKLMAQRCGGCGELRYPAAPVCPVCLDPHSEWQELSGRGEVFSFVVFHRGYHPYWAARVPYNVAMIELEEGLRMFSNVVGIANEHLRVGEKVKVAFERREDLVVPVFEPDRTGDAGRDALAGRAKQGGEAR